MSSTVPPVFTTRPQDQEVTANGRIALECAAEGIPTPSITWKVNNTAYACEFPWKRPFSKGESDFRKSFIKIETPLKTNLIFLIFIWNLKKAKYLFKYDNSVALKMDICVPNSQKEMEGEKLKNCSNFKFPYCP